MADSKAKIIISAEDRTKQAFDRISGSLTHMTALAGTAVVAGMLAAVKSTAQLNDEMLKAAQSVGTTTESLSGLKYAADLGGVSFEQLSVGLGKLAKSTEDYRDGLSSAVDTFKKIKVDPTQFKDTSQLFEAVAEQLSKLPDGAQKTAIAMELLGKSGAKLIPLMNGGAAGIKAAREEAEKLGVIISTDTAKQSEKLNDDIARLTTAFDGLKISVANKAIPGMVEITEKMVEATKQGGLLKGVIVGVGESFKQLMFGSDRSNDLDRANFGIPSEIIRKATELRNLTRDPNSNFADKKRLELEIRDLANEKNNLLKKHGLLDPLLDSNNKNEDKSSVITPVTSSSSAPKGKSDLEKQREDLAKLINEFERAAKPAQSQAEALQETLNNYGKLDSSVKNYLDGLIKQIELTDQLQKQQADYAELEALQRTSDDEALRQLEESSAAEQDRIANMEAQAQAVRELFDPTLKLLNIQAKYDDLLNEGLITQEEYDYALKKIQDTTTTTSNLSKELGRTFSSAFEDAVLNGEDFGDTLDGLLRDLDRLALQAVTNPIFKAFETYTSDFVAEAISGLFFNAKGGVYSGSGISAYSNQIVSSPTMFPFAKGVGLMGEAGPEAIVPLRRTSNGALGIQTTGVGGDVTVNIIGAPTQPNIRKTQDDNGNTNIDVMFERVESYLGSRMAKGQGAIADVLSGGYGLNRGAGAQG